MLSAGTWLLHGSEPNSRHTHLRADEKFLKAFPRPDTVPPDQQRSHTEQLGHPLCINLPLSGHLPTTGTDPGSVTGIYQIDQTRNTDESLLD